MALIGNMPYKVNRFQYTNNIYPRHPATPALLPHGAPRSSRGRPIQRPGCLECGNASPIYPPIYHSCFKPPLRKPSWPHYGPKLAPRWPQAGPNMLDLRPYTIDLGPYTLDLRPYSALDLRPYTLDLGTLHSTPYYTSDLRPLGP